MKRFIILLVMIVPFIAKSQQLLNYSDLEIKEYMKNTDALFSGKKYAQDGGEYLLYEFSLLKPVVPGVTSIAFFLNDDHKCFKYTYLYNDQRYIDDLKLTFKGNTNLVKVKDSFSWENVSKNYDVGIIPQDDKFFFLIYRIHQPTQ